MKKLYPYIIIPFLIGALLIGGCKSKQNAVVKKFPKESTDKITNEKVIYIDTKGTYKPVCEHRTVHLKEPTQKDKYDKAFEELEAMLNGETEPDFERAVFLSENPYHNNIYTYEDFQRNIDWHLLFIKSLIAANDKSDSMEFDVKVNSNGRFNMDDIRYLPKEKKELYTKALANWAIFTYLTDTTALFPFYNLPFTYSTQDPFGIKDWTNSQVIGLLTSEEQKGNCYSMTALYKILADRLNTGARLCTAPQHIYIQHRDPKGHYYNVELATAGHPTDGMIQVLTHTTSDAIKSGIALRNYDEKQSIGLCLINLAKSYEHSFETKDDGFMLRCAELTLKYDGLNLNALLLKQQILDARVNNYAKANNIQHINTLKRDTVIGKTMMELERHTATLYGLGYRQMPLDMQEMVLTGINKTTVNKNPSPFTTITPKDPRDNEYVTLSGGVFQEVFETKPEETFGNFTYNTTTKTITKLNPSPNTQNSQLIDPVAFAYDFGARIYDARLGRWLSVDPKYRKYPFQSPYVGVNNNPIYFTDPTGGSAIATIDKVNKKITVTATLTLYQNGMKGTTSEANTALAKQTASQIQNQLNEQCRTVEIDGEQYEVVFEINGEYKSGGDVNAEAKKNTSYEQNYMRVDGDGTQNSTTATDAKQEGSDEYNGGNSFYIRGDESVAANENSTAPAHEFLHGLGLKHVSIGTSIVGIPGMMTTVMDNVEQQYTIPSATAVGKAKLNKDTRKFSDAEFSNLNLAEKFKGAKDGTTINLGAITNKLYNADRSDYKAKPSEPPKK